MSNKGIQLIAFISLFVLQNTFLYSYITLDTNELSTLTNVTITSNSDLTNVQLKTIPEPEMPNAYLSSGKIEVEKPETTARRVDLIYWIAMPAIYYFTISAMYLKNQLAFGSTTVDSADMNYVYLNTFMVPLSAAYFDFLYLQEQYALKARNYGMYSNAGDQFFVSIPIFHLEF
jgi:hypothetical protein